MESRRLDRRIASLLLATLALVVLPSRAADGTLTAVGTPAGGTVYQVVVDPAQPSTLYAHSDPGIFESTDGGATWTLVFSDPGAITDLAIDPQGPSTLYVTTQLDQVYKSVDGGATWATVTTP